MLQGALGGASLGCWGRQSPLSPEPAGEGRGISSNVPGERSGVDPLAAPSSAERELQRDTTTRTEQERWKRRK